MLKLQNVRGTKDLLPDAFEVHDFIIANAKALADIYGYNSISVPTIEYSAVFNRTLGDSSDVISKEIYSFLDKSGESLSLRPEFTAGIMRSFISNCTLAHKLPLKFFTYGSVFRYDRPQAGRQREFTQANFEYIGAKGAYTDAEMIKLAVDLLSKLNLQKSAVLEINSLGSSESRAIYQEQLKAYFADNKNKLSEDSLRRLEKNPMRILDSKDHNDKILVANAPSVADYYDDYSKQYFEDVLKYLDLLDIKYIINPKLVRGLDYYSHTAFEFIGLKQNAQSTILAGGRYDGLAEVMGSSVSTPAIGFALGIERIALMKKFEQEITSMRKVSCAVLPIEDANIPCSLLLADKLRSSGLKTLLCTEGKISKRMQKIIATGVKFAIFIGEEEEKSNLYKLKNLDTAMETSADLQGVITTISNAS